MPALEVQESCVYNFFFSFKLKAFPGIYMHPYTLFLELPFVHSPSVKLLILACLGQERCLSVTALWRGPPPLRSLGLGQGCVFPPSTSS